jgi:uncharacterized protein
VLDEEIPTFWRSLGIPGLIDIHVHFMPDRVQEKVWSFFDTVGPRTGIDWPISYRLPDAVRLELLRAWGVRAFPALSYPHKSDMAAWLNGWALGFADAEPDVVRAGTFFPEPSATDYVAAALEDGVRIFKAHLQVGGYDPRDRLLQPVWGQLTDACVPVVVHCGSGPAPGAFTGPGPIGDVLAAHPRLTLVVAHLGMPEYADFLALAESYPAVHLDTTMAFTDFTERIAPFPPALRPRLADLADRIVLGSDFPTIPYPYAHQLAALARLDLGEEWLRGVCWRNGARLLGVDAPPPPAG